ncbi:alpha/beta hydrolase-fold protein [Archangium sp.]|uniref:alpha/beta hydrolase-fold protein n=1 Tax=Archangium sp. TaxID=1872627 RepID=UPI00389A6BE0
MTQRQPSRLPFLLLLALTALAGCDPKPPPTTPPAEQRYSDVRFDVTVPPETPVNATLLLEGADPSFNGSSGQGLELIFQGGTTFSVKAKLPTDKALTYRIVMTTPGAQVALDAAGAAVPERTVTVHETEENVSFSVERWGPESGDTQPRLAFLVQVPEASTPLDNGLWLSGNAPELGGGKPDGVKLYKAVNDRYVAVLSFAPNTSLEYRVTRGTADTVEAGSHGEDLTRTHTTKSGLERLELAVGRWGDVPSQLTFKVTVPPETPADAHLVLKSNNEVLGAGLALTYQGGTTFQATVALRRGLDFSYNVQMTAPSAQVALDTAGAVVPPRSFKVNADEMVNLTVERWGPESGDTEPRIAFVVAYPSNTPAADSLYIVGNQDQVGPWDPGLVRMYKAVNNRFAITLSFTPGTSLEYKFTRGSWDTVEKGPAGEEIDNRTYSTGSGFARLFLTVAKWADLDGVPATPVLTGNIKYLRDVTPKDTTLKKRDVIVWLPPDYEANPSRHYPVLYMHDGQNLMDATTAFAGEWGVDETAQQLVESGQVEPVIIVGVYNTADRIPEYTQVSDATYGGGRADDYGKFLVEELKPLIDSTYRTKPEAQYTGLAGSSLGGLVSMYLGMKYPGTFSRLGVVSPSVWWANKDILSKVNALTEKPALRIWEDIGTAESGSSTENTETVADADALRDALVNKGWVLDSDLKYTVVDGAKHNEKAWAARFGDILKYLYPVVP